MNKVKLKHVFTYYLPQYHEIPENNLWWGEGFTEWTNLKKAEKLHEKQEILYPGELGYYNLLDVSIIEQQYKLAKEHSIDTFCFWHYWFNDNDTLLEKPAELVLNSDIEINYCFAWANHSWLNKSINRLLKEQRYDFSLEIYFDYLQPFFCDNRYRKINNKPVFFIFKPSECKNLNALINYFNKRAKNLGFDGIYFIFENTNQNYFYKNNLDGLFLNSAPYLKNRSLIRKIYDKLKLKFTKNNSPRFYDYRKCTKDINKSIKKNTKELPFVFPCWDSTIRHGKKGICLLNSTPENFKLHLHEIIKTLPDNVNERIIVIKSWNEWAEGNAIEPSSNYGRQYLEIFNNIFSINN